MKAFNVGVSVAVAVLAVVSAVFAFLMMQKNGVIQEGWSAFVTEVGATAKALDQKSGAPIAKKLSKEALAIGNAGEINSVLKPLARRASEVIKQRDAFAKALCSIADIIGAADITSDEALCNLSSYAESGKSVVEQTKVCMENHSRVFTRLAAVAQQNLSVSISPDALGKGDTSAIDPLVAAINKQANTNRSYERELDSIAGKVNVRFDKDKVYGVSEGVSTALDVLKSEKSKLSSDLASAQRTISEKEGALKESAEKVAGLQGEIAKRDQAIASYKRALGLAGANADEMPWPDGSIDARRAVVGHVIYVDEKYGYVTIDLGSATTVEQKLGTKTLPVNPQITPGMEMIVSRGAIGDNADFVARIKLKEVGATCSTAYIPPDAQEIEEGDFVYISL